MVHGRARCCSAHARSRPTLWSAIRPDGMKPDGDAHARPAMDGFERAAEAMEGGGACMPRYGRF